ncbi:argininosuccinate lyase [Nitrospira moscoviensis]|uniref:Argininosuccinate lyase n=1 Tax=Nitrospira moscoviensis TaxID=42253 RepID=A0A0K2G7A4_NITMO|nr:argininosuccinate lyase [Nitrospira moscoviensis]ALA56838.1 Argininosuccinate lyase [Nitrospira moscoviensis]
MPQAKGKSRPRGVKKAWAGRFAEQTDRLVEAFTRSIEVDRRLYRYDIDGSIAHCRTLTKARILTGRESAAIIRGLESVRAELERDQFKFLPEDEDIHMAIERRLTELIGPLGGKLHTGRSRNDQVALDARVYVRDRLAVMINRLKALQRVLVRQAQANRDVAMPGYTHLQRAQPVLFAHHLLAYVEMFERDKGRLRDARTRANVMPLGSGALAGSNYPIDRRYTAALLNFPALSQNSLDAVSDRDFMVEAVAAMALLMMHLSRLSEELILWSTQEFHFVDLPDAFCTGSSMMPQKKNPDVPELVRGKTGRVYGHLMGLLTTLKALPLSYNRDLQEDKPALFDAFDQTDRAVEVMTELMRRLAVDREAVTRALSGGGMLATEIADYLVTKGVPFREAHEITGRIVRWALDQGRELSELSVEELRRFSEKFDSSVLQRLTVRGAIDRKAQIGGTASKQVDRRLRDWAKTLS